MAPTRLTLPDFFETDPDNQDRIRCTLCGGNNWIQRKGWKAHTTRGTHLAATERDTALDGVRSAVRKAYEEAQAHPARLARADLPDSPPLPDIDMVPPLDETFPDNQPGGFEVDLDYARAAVAAAHAETAEEFQAKLTMSLADLVHGFRAMQMTQDVSAGGDLDEALCDTVEGDDAALDAEEIEAAFFDTTTASALSAQASDWFPYDNKTLVFLHMLRSLPRLRMSDALTEMVLFVMEQTGARSVPSMFKLRQCEKQLQELIGAPTVQHKSELGNIFYSNDIRATIAMEFANPQIARHFRFYPVLNAQRVSEVWHATRWWEVPPELLTPMAVAGNLSFFVDELCLLHDGSFKVPFIWFQYDDSNTDSNASNEIYAMCYTCKIDETSGRLTLDTSAPVEIPLSRMAIPLPALIMDSGLPPLDSSCLKYSVENPLRALAQNDELYTVFVNLWADDVSGNVSKQYNKHLNIYVSNMNLPSALLSQEFFVRFFSTSPHASAAEQFAAIKEQILSSHATPYPCYNAHTGRICRFRLVAQALPGDNPQQAENCSCLLGQANLNCRRCKNVRRAPKDSVGVDWYIKNYSKSEPRTTEATLASIQEQFVLAASGKATKVAEEQTRTGVKDPIAEYWVKKLLAMARERIGAGGSSPEEVAQELKLWLESQPGEHYHPLLRWSGLDPHVHTPVEILHTILLGLAKYVWHSLHTTCKTEHEALFTVRLQSSDITGLSIDPLRAAYMMQYKNGLIGKHFKSLTQLMVFHIHGISTPEQFALVKATGLLAAMLWYHEIEDMDQYLEDVQILIDNVLDAYAKMDPTRILTKFKLHVLVHLVDDIPRYGPAIRFATEIFESFNAIFRMCSVLSNHQAPSRDIAVALARIDCFKHIVSGGFWFDKSTKTWRQASEKVRGLLEHKIVQRHLGWSPAPSLRAGVVVPVAAKKRTPRSLSPSQLAVLHSSPSPNLHAAANTSLQWIDGVSVTAKTGDVCRPNSWVVFDAGDGSTHVGRLMQISVLYQDSLVRVSTAVVAVKEYTLSPTLHPEFDMPILTCNNNAQLHVLKPEALQFNLNVQHDCRSCDCQPTATRPILQERQETTRTILEIQHKQDERYVINLHAFHNAALVHKVLPSALCRPRRITADRDTWLETKAHEAEVIVSKKKDDAQRKRAETRANKTAGPAPAKKANTKRKRAAVEVESEDGEESTDSEVVSGAEAQEDGEAQVPPGAVNDVGPSTRSRARISKRQRL